MNAVELGLLDLDEPVSRRLSTWRGADRESVTVRDLLAHCSGLTAYLPFFRDYRGRVEFERAISELPLEYAPRSQSVYSDLGFMLLGFILEDVARKPLAEQFERVAALVGARAAGSFVRRASWRSRTAPTETDPWRGRLLVGEVHDENAWALGGAAGHAGLFGTAAAVGSFARLVFKPPSRHGARTAQHVADSSRAAATTFPAVRARSAGTRCCRHHPAGRCCRHPRSATPASPARRSGSIPIAISTSSC